jgi:AraC family transcriptional regulator, regulatory protein of adaptative response / methylated-DNA-[protein]-cysteine methyltransferase
MLDQWKIVNERRPGEFIYAVRTTGVFCKPGCASRLPNRGNVDFFDSAARARLAGYRPCKRCKPETAMTATQTAIVEAARTIADSTEPPSVSELSARAGFSASRFQRLFKQVVGVTPKAYADSHRNERARRELSGGASVTRSAFAAGFNSSTRFYENAKRALGMKPAAWRAGAPGERIMVGTAACSLGRVLVAATERGLCAIQLGDDDADLTCELQRRLPCAELVEDAKFAATVRKVVAFIDEPSSRLDLPLDVRGTAFQCRVWEELRRIPAGETRTYTEVAERVGKPKAVRAVANACATNLLAVVIPCHRVKRTDGSQGGYRWGIERKEKLQGAERRRR